MKEIEFAKIGETVLQETIKREDYDEMPEYKLSGMDVPVHRYANWIEGTEHGDMQVLRRSLRAIGLLNPIVLYEGAILDGRHRYLACKAENVPIEYRDFGGDDLAALEFVLAQNLARRQLTVTQKRRLWERLGPEVERLRIAARERQATLNNDDPSLRQPVVEAGRVDEQVGNMIGVSRETVRQWAAIDKAPIEVKVNLLERMDRKELSTKAAYKELRMIENPKEQDQADFEGVRSAIKSLAFDSADWVPEDWREKLSVKEWERLKPQALACFIWLEALLKEEV